MPHFSRTLCGLAGCIAVLVGADAFSQGASPDDDDEPNDSAATATRMNEFGFRRTARVLNPGNEDWYEFVVKAAVTNVTATMNFEHAAYDTAATLELQDVAGNSLAASSSVDVNGWIRVESGPLAASTYRVRVRHDAGDRLASYDLQVFAPLVLAPQTLRFWTINRPYDDVVGVTGGTPPYRLSTQFDLPPGIVAFGDSLHLTGTPRATGWFNAYLAVGDADAPSNFVSSQLWFAINAKLTLSYGEFIAFAFGKAHDRKGGYPGPVEGGTSPLTVRTLQGALPHGMSFEPNDFRFIGTPDTPGASPVEFEVTDLAGDTDVAQTTAVVCVPFGRTSLAEGRAACGFYFDAVLGTTASISIETSSGQPTRALRVMAFGPDGATEMTTVATSGAGLATISGLTCPESGRYFVVVAGDLGEPTLLLGKGAIAPPTKGRGSQDAFGGGSPPLILDVGALPGAVLTFKAVPDRKSGLVLRMAWLKGPDGELIELRPSERNGRRGRIALKKRLALGGTWTLTVDAPASPSGSMKYAFTIRQPKHAVYSSD